jgi:hypothetical protein
MWPIKLGYSVSPRLGGRGDTLSPKLTFARLIGLGQQVA